MPLTTRITRRFLLHYLEMVAVMFAGMGVLMLPSDRLLGALGSGWSELRVDAPALMLLWMAATMAGPMAAWMAFRGHSVRANAEMAAAMILPTLALIATMGAGAIADVDAAMALEHVLMLGAMFAVMLARPEEYSFHAHGVAR